MLIIDILPVTIILLIVSVITAIIINIINTHEKNSIDNNKN